MLGGRGGGTIVGSLGGAARVGASGGGRAGGRVGASGGLTGVTSEFNDWLLDLSLVALRWFASVICSSDIWGHDVSLSGNTYKKGTGRRFKFTKIIKRVLTGMF